LDFVIADQTLLPIIDSNGNKMEVGACRSKISDLENQNSRLLTNIDALNVKISELQVKLDNASQIANGEVSSNSSNTVTVPADSFQASTQNSTLNLFQFMIEWFKKLGLWKK
jgi:phage shock protein A